jgi:tRNA(Ile)-lysidine synthase
MKTSFGLENEVRKTIRKFEMLRDGDHVLVGASGGADSMALLYALVRLAPRLHLTVTAAHLNHGVRGADADADQAFVARACRELGIECLSGRANLRAGGDFEQRARRARYEFLRRAAQEAAVTRIAVGHTLNDQAETVLLRLFRGSGADGLAAIHPVVDGIIVRPLLYCSRDQVIHYLTALGIPWREDASNADLRVRRNRIRHELLPQLAENFNPDIIATLAREADLSREIAEYLNAAALPEYKWAQRSSPGGEANLQIHEMLKTGPVIQKYLVRNAIRNARGSIAGVTTRHVDAVLRLLSDNASGRRVALPGGMVAIREFGTLRFCPAACVGSGTGYCYPLYIPGTCAVPEAGLSITATIVEEPVKQGDPGQMVILDAGAVSGSLTVRSRLPGDRYGGSSHQKVKSMLIDAKVPTTDRDRLPMVALGNAVIWVPGFRPAKFFAVSPNSSRCIVLELRRD